MSDTDAPTPTTDFDHSQHAGNLAADFDGQTLERGQTRKLLPSEVQRVIRMLADGVPQSEIAKAVGVTQSAISYLKSKYEPTVDAARALIQSRSEKVARQWLRSVPIAARKGDHRPAKDWLAAAGVVAQDKPQVSPIIIQVGTGTVVSVDGADPFDEAKVTTNEK